MLFFHLAAAAAATDIYVPPTFLADCRLAIRRAAHKVRGWTQKRGSFEAKSCTRGRVLRTLTRKLMMSLSKCLRAAAPAAQHHQELAAIGGDTPP